MVEFLALDQNLVPSHALEGSQSLSNIVQYVRINGVPSKGIYKLHATDPPRWTFAVRTSHLRRARRFNDDRINQGFGTSVFGHRLETAVIFGQRRQSDFAVA